MMRHKSMLILLLLLSFTLGYGVLATTARQNAHHGLIVSPPLEKAQKIYGSSGDRTDRENRFSCAIIRKERRLRSTPSCAGPV